MKNKKLKTTKFNLEKFEVARLSNLKNINGGNGESGPINTGTDLGTLSTKNCKSLTTSISDTNPNNTDSKK